jgi:CheY-like chemotaxis protein
MKDNIDILVVDDNPAMATTLVDILTAKGYLAHAATSGAEALKFLHSRQVNILLTDVKMADINGVELYIKTKRTHPDIIPILMTAFAADDLIRQGMEAGVKTVLTKPLDIDFLLMLLSAASNTQFYSHTGRRK